MVQPQVSINEVKKVQLRPVNRVQETPKEEDRHDDREEENPRPVRMSVRDRMAMFNGGGKPRYTPSKPVEAPVVNGNAPGLEKVTEAVVTAQTSPTKKKRPFTFASANQMSFKIVESTPTIN